MVVYVCRQDCVFDGLVPRRCVVGVGDCGVCVVFIYGRGEWCGWGCAILYGRGEWHGWVCYVWFGYDARRYVWLLMGCVGAFVVVPGCSRCHYTVWADTILSGNAVVWYPPIHVLLSSAGFRVIMSHEPYS